MKKLNNKVLITSLLILQGFFFSFSPAFAIGTGTNTVSPTSTSYSSTNNTLQFIFTAAEDMSDGGGIDINVPAGWTTPNGVSGTAGYTTASTTGTIGRIFDTADGTQDASTWGGSACSGGITNDLTLKQEGTGSVKCVNSSESNHDVMVKNITAQDWTSFTTVGFWIRSSATFSNGNLSFIYANSQNASFSNQVESLQFGKAGSNSITANTWTHVTFTFGSTAIRNNVQSYGFQINNSSVQTANIWVDDFTIGVGSGSTVVPNFSGNHIQVSNISLTNGQTITVNYGTGAGGAATAPSTAQTSTFTTGSRANSSVSYDTIVTSPTVTVTDSIAPTGGSISYTDGYFTSASVALTASDGTDSASGINTSTRIVQRDSATLSGGTCGSYTGTFSTITPTGTYSNFTDSTVSSGNCYKYKYLVSDNSGNQATYTSNNVAKVDTAAPTGGSVSYTNGYFTSASVSVTVSDGSDSGGSGINTSTRVLKRDSATLSGGTCGSYTGTFSTVTTSGSYPNFTDASVSSGNCYKYQYLVSDAAGNQATYTSSNVAKVDTAAPTGGSVSYTNGYFTSASVPVTYTTGSDSISGLNTGSGKIKRASATLSGGTCGAFSSFTDLHTGFSDSPYSDTTVTSDHCYKYQYVIQDAAGNQATYTSSNVAKVDTAAPTGGSVSYTSGYYTTESVTITYDIGTDLVSGLNTGTGKIKRASAALLTDGTCDTFGSFSDLHTGYTDSPYSDTTVSSGNCYEYQYFIEDTAGNQTTYTSSDMAKVDSGKPTTSDDYAHNDTWVTTHQTITLIPTDAFSGVAVTKYCIDSSDTCDPSVGTILNSPYQILMSAEGVRYLRYASTDNASNVQDTVSRTVKIDDTPPSVNAGVDKTRNATFLENAATSDDASGVATYQWSQESGAGIITFGSATSEDTTISADTEDTYVIRLTVVDNAGNFTYDEFTLTWSAIIVDTNPPQTNDDYGSKDGVWQNTNQTITLSPDDDISGVASTKYCIDTNNTCDPSVGTLLTSPYQVTISTEGTNYFRYRSIDNDGNIETAVSRTVKIDKTIPTINGVSFSPTTGILQVGDTLTVIVTADAPGYTDGTISINGVAPDTFVDNHDGTYTLTHIITGGEGNIVQNDQIALSIVLLDQANNESVPFTTSPSAVDSPAINANDHTSPSVIINQSNSQSDPTNSTPVTFSVVWSEAIDTDTFTTDDITQMGTASSITWGITDTGDHIHFTLSATAVGSDGTIVPTISASKVYDLLGNANSDSTSTDNTVIYDATLPLLSSVTPASSSTIDTVTSSSAIAFTSSEALASGSITITRMSGTADAIVHTCTLTGTALNSGTHTIDLSDIANSCTSDVSNLISGTTYSFVFTGTDFAGNTAASITRTGVLFRIIVPTTMVTGITVTGAGNATTITTAGGTLQMSANVLPIDATDGSVSWSVASDTGRANIDSSGLLTAVSNGIVIVRATANDGSGIYGEITITITGQNIPTTVSPSGYRGTHQLKSVPIATVFNKGTCKSEQILTQNMKAGARNGVYNSFTHGKAKEVKILQAHMNRLGFASGKEDGILGPITDGAIKRMQKFLGTKQDGLIGPVTRELINNSCGNLR